MELTKIINEKREQFCVTKYPYTVLCDQLFAMGHEFKFGDEFPIHVHLRMQHEHYKNGVIGSKEEFEKLAGKPVPLEVEDPLGPVAVFVARPELVQKAIDSVEETVTKVEESGGDILSLHNAGLLDKKKDIAEYAKLFNIKLKSASNISKAMMLKTLESKARDQGVPLLEDMSEQDLQELQGDSGQEDVIDLSNDQPLED